MKNSSLKSSASFVENISISSGISRDYSTTATSSQSYNFEAEVFINSEVGIETGMNVNGIGVTGGFNVKTGINLGASTSTEMSNSRTVGVYFADDDIGDEFNVSIKEDNVNATLVFETTGAVSNNVAPGKATFKIRNPAGTNTEFAFQNDGGAVMPASGYVQFGSVTTTERNALTAANGMVIYNSTDNKFQGYENGSWVNLV